MAFGTFLRANPALAPLFLFAGGGCAAAVSYPLYLLRTHPEIQIDRKNNPFPWVRVQQHENIKFITSRPEFYESRKNVERPSF
ncbi:NADH dehydrogenase 1 alpha subcomplex subunit 4 ndufa4 [Apophysomyces sp. BC1015]|nr:NADH dehydrogenase 1 alpha subcomplex subunit 4 ndufa4 [Apophysomyces sp. BC1015]KAG0180764.1 NADH dehydrogenase 1 alpha subcomplex subunit 4 ndufa4 [Apophysomyces sp. BC1021]